MKRTWMNERWVDSLCRCFELLPWAYLVLLAVAIFGAMVSPERAQTSAPIASADATPGNVALVGAITGNYTDAIGNHHGFVRDPHGTITTFDPPGSKGTFPASINSTGAMAGSYEDAHLITHGFVRDPSSAHPQAAPQCYANASKC